MDATRKTLVRDLPFAEAARLRFTGDVVSVIALPVADGSAPRMTVELPDDEDDLLVDVSEREGTVYVTVERREALRRILRRNWQVECRLELPSPVEAMIRTDAGQLTVRDLDGRFDLQTEAGRIGLRSVTGQVKLRTEAGKVDCTGFRGSIDASTSAGAIHFEADALAAGTHLLRADVGKIDVRLPGDANIRVETRTSIGRARNAFGSGKSDAPALLRVQTEVGAISIQPALGAAPRAEYAGSGRSAEARQAEIMRILEQVAAHEMNPEEANRRIAALRY